MSLRSLFIGVALGVAANVVQADSPSQTDKAGLLYQLESAVTLPSTNSGWDYIKMEPNSSRLFVERDRDGLTVFDVDQSKAITTVKNSVVANSQQQIPRYNRGYVAMTDGSLLSARGLPTPNLFTGGSEWHSVREWASLQDMASAAAT